MAHVMRLAAWMQQPRGNSARFLLIVPPPARSHPAVVNHPFPSCLLPSQRCRSYPGASNPWENVPHAVACPAPSPVDFPSCASPLASACAQMPQSASRPSGLSTEALRSPRLAGNSAGSESSATVRDLCRVLKATPWLPPSPMHDSLQSGARRFYSHPPTRIKHSRAGIQPCALGICNFTSGDGYLATPGSTALLHRFSSHKVREHPSTPNPLTVCGRWAYF